MSYPMYFKRGTRAENAIIYYIHPVLEVLEICQHPWAIGNYPLFTALQIKNVAVIQINGGTNLFLYTTITSNRIIP